MMDAFVAMPDGGGTHPGLVVIHEMYGLNDNIRDIATRFADEGYAVMAPNLYSRVGGAVRFCMTQLFKAFIKMKMDQRAVRDLRGACGPPAEHERRELGPPRRGGFLHGRRLFAVARVRV